MSTKKKNHFSSELLKRPKVIFGRKKSKTHLGIAKSGCFRFLICSIAFIAGSSDPRLTLQESPTRFSPTKLQPKTKDAAEDYDIKNKTGKFNISLTVKCSS